MTAADAKMDGYALFRGEVSALPQDLNQSEQRGGCCEGPECCSPMVQARFAALNLRNLRLRGSLRYLVLTGVPDDSQRQIQTRQA